MKAATLTLLAVLLATAGCGRFAFDPLTPGGDDDDGDGGVGDGPRDDGGAPAGWWDGDWHYRMKLSFGDPGQALQDVPIMVALDGQRISYANASASGADIRFVDADNITVLPYEIERWNSGGASYLWVRVPQINIGTTDFIWLYYGNPTAAPAQDPAVWTSYALAWHLDDNPAGTAPQISDSTTNANSGTAAGGIPATAQAAGKVVGAITFDGTDDWIAGPGSTTLRAVGDVTLSMWMFRTAASRDEWLCDFSTPMSEQEGNNHLYELSFDNSNNIQLQWEYNGGSDEAAQSTSPLASAINQWAFITVTRNVTANEVRFYENGALLGNPVTYTNDPTGGTTGSFWFGGMLDTTSSKQPFQGRFDEVRVEARSRGPAWIATQYKSMSDTYVTYGAAETY